jgi:hypothetical protein
MKTFRFGFNAPHRASYRAAVEGGARNFNENSARFRDRTHAVKGIELGPRRRTLFIGSDAVNLISGNQFAVDSPAADHHSHGRATRA